MTDKTCNIFMSIQLWRESKTSRPNKQPKEKHRMRRKQKLVTSILVATGSDMIATVMILGSLAVII